MALTDKKYEKFYKTTGTGNDKIDSDKLSFAEEVWDLDRANGMKDHVNNPDFAPLIFQLQQIQDELDYLRTEISANKDKTGISTSQADAIVANTAKVSMVIGTGKGEAMSGQTNLVTVGTQAHQAMAGNTTIPPISITGLPANHTFNVQVRVVPPVRGAKKGTVVLTWTIEDVPNKVVYSSNQTLI